MNRAVLAVFAALCGCATLRVDVDVYQGPLAHEDQVQLHEVIALAVGAKPLLVQLRDHLQTANSPISLEELRRQPWYEAAYVDPGQGEGRRLRANAERVNAILSLYLDLDRSPSASIAGDLRESIAAYQRAYDRVNGIGHEGEADQALWEAIRQHIDDRWREPLETYLLVRDGRRFTADLLAQCSAAGIPLSLPDVGLVSEVPESATLRYLILAQPETWTRIAAAAMKEPAPASRLRSRGPLLARAFVDARTELQRIFRLGSALARGESKPANRQAALQMAASTLSRTRAMDAIREWSATRGTDLSGTLDALGEHRSTAGMLAAARRLVADGIQGDPDLFLVELLEQAADVYIANHASPLERLERQFGPVSGPVRTEQSSTPPTRDNLEASLSRFSDAHGLGTARTNEGLDSLIKDWLERTKNTTEDSPVQRRTLFQALTQFAEKLRVVATFQDFLGSTGASRETANVLEAIATSILTQINHLEDSQWVLSDPLKEEEKESDPWYAKLESGSWRRASLANPSPQVIASRAPACPPEFDDPRDVIDVLVMQLRYALIQATEAGDPASKQIDNLRKAIELAEEHSSGYVYLQPAAAMIKNGYPASSLQPTPLSFRTATEVLGATGARNPTETADRDMAIRLDKAYWQNINNITLSGTGTTNFTVAKDDVGNWTIKAFSADPTKLVETLKNLALSAAGGISPLANIDALKLEQYEKKLRTAGVLSTPEEENLKRIRAESGSGKVIAAFVGSHLKTANQKARKQLEELDAVYTKFLADLKEAERSGFPAAPAKPKPLDQPRAEWDSLRKWFAASAVVLANLKDPTPAESNQRKVVENQIEAAELVTLKQGSRPRLDAFRAERLAIVTELRKSLETAGQVVETLNADAKPK